MYLFRKVPHPLVLEILVTTELQGGLEKALSNSVKNSRVTGTFHDILSTSLCNEIRLNEELFSDVRYWWVELTGVILCLLGTQSLVWEDKHKLVVVQ